MAYNYKKTYQSGYKRLPTYFFWGALISMLLEIFVAGVALMPYGLLIWFLCPPLAVGFAFWVRWFVSLFVSQRVVVADSLIALVNQAEAQKTEFYTQSATSIAADEEIFDLPEL